MINLSPAEMMTLRAVRKTAALLMMFMRVDPMPVTVQDVSAVFGIDEKTATKQLQELALLGKIIRNGYRAGYILAESGKQISLDALFLSAPGNLQISETGNSPVSENGTERETGNSPVSETKKSAKPEIFRFETGNSPVSGTLVVEDILVNRLLVDSTEHETGNSPVSQTISLADVLALTPRLFDGSVVSASGLERVNPMDALKWIAYAWKNNNLNSPCGLIYSRLKKHAKPPEGVEIDSLPNWALKALGFEVNEAESNDEPAEQETGETVATMSADASVTETVTALWESVKTSLQAEMPRASFETWLRDTQPVKYNGALWVGARNQYGAEWLSDKLSTTVERLLVEAGHPLPVKFVILDDEGEA